MLEGAVANIAAAAAIWAGALIVAWLASSLPAAVPSHDLAAQIEALLSLPPSIAALRARACAGELRRHCSRLQEALRAPQLPPGVLTSANELIGVSLGAFQRIPSLADDETLAGVNAVREAVQARVCQPWDAVVLEERAAFDRVLAERQAVEAQRERLLHDTLQRSRDPVQALQLMYRASPHAHRPALRPP